MASLFDRRRCAWCGELIPPAARRDAVTCSRRCRQARARDVSRTRRVGDTSSAEPGFYRRLRQRAVAAASMLDTAAHAKGERVRAGFIADAAREIRELVAELDREQARAWDETMSARRKR